MARRKTKFPFVQIEWALLDSKAWGELTNAARVLYVVIKRDKTNATKKELKPTYDQFERVMDRHTIRKAMDKLLEWGFIMMEQRGGLKRKKNIYILSDEWRRHGKDPRCQ
jgi:hypothetical protein